VSPWVVPEDAAGDDVVGIFGQLVLGQPDHDPVDRGRGDGEQEQAADGLKEAVESLEDDPDLEDPVEGVPRAEAAHDPRTVKARVILGAGDDPSLMPGFAVTGVSPVVGRRGAMADANPPSHRRRHGPG
jgi:hypothetical protein